MQTLKVQTVKVNEGPLNEFNGIKVGDRVKTIEVDEKCYPRYTEWLDAYGFDRTNWKYDDYPTANFEGKVVGIAKHLNSNYGDTLFYIDTGTHKYIMTYQVVELVESKEIETKNYCLVNRGKMNFYIIE